MSTTISRSITTTPTIDPNARKKRSTQHPSNSKSIKSANTGRWKTRPIRTPIQLTSQEKKQAYELLNRFNGMKDFSLPLELPAWSPPMKLEDINQDLMLIRDYGSRSPSDFDRLTQPKEERPKQIDSTNNDSQSTSRTRVESTKTYDSPHPQSSKQSPSTSAPPTTTAATIAATAASSSASPDTYSSPPDQPSRTTTNERICNLNHRVEPAPSSKVNRVELNSRDRSTGSLKGKEKCEPEIDWTGWEPQNYVTDGFERLRQKYEQRAKELKRLSDSQRQQISIARESSVDPKTLIPEGLDEISDLATIGCVESLLLFTQAFLCFGLNRSSNRMEHRQWDTMVGFLSVAKSTARRSGIELTYAICLMYESLLLDRLVEGDRPLLLQAYSHETDPEKMREGFKRIKRILNYQEISKASWSTSQTMFEKILQEGDDEEEKNYRNVKLPELKRLMSRMRNRNRTMTPKILSLDKPYKFCWPIDKSNLDSMADFVVFSSAALDEFLSLNRSKIPYQLSKFNDSKILFPNS